MFFRFLEGSEFARQFCHPILHEDLGQELCAPPFQVVCPFQALVLLTLTSVFDLWQICWTDLYDFFCPAVLPPYLPMKT